MKIKKGDNVQVISGVDAGKTGEVLKAMPKDNKVIVKGVNIRKRHTKPRSQADQGGIVEFEAPLNASKVMIVDGKKVRVCKKSGEVLKDKKTK